MHEFSIASGLVEKVTAFAEERAPIRVLKVRLAIGNLMCIQAEQLAFCYNALTEDTPIGGSSLEIEMVPPVVSCTNCGYTGAPKYWEDPQLLSPVPTMSCPKCGSTTEAIEGDQCSIRTISYAQ
ncbi:MAG TPA: hydrogenase maturation nickel metallochaperone HypA [Opitutaceae bacterium]|jgi:hydrogenase nickel incorporation protein HypA/HybF|nr:hydrogenase maturation nickel metallochaperone HypA [Opitutaceae bacterium]